MEKKKIILFFFVLIGNICYSIEDIDYDNFFNNINYTLNRVRELCIYDLNPSSRDNHYITIEAYREHLMDIYISINEFILMTNEETSIKKLLSLINYEINEILNTNNEEIDSNRVVAKIDFIFSILLCVDVIKYYEPTMFEDSFKK